MGRGNSQDVIIADTTVSDTHALITVSDDEVIVKDLKSRLNYSSYVPPILFKLTVTFIIIHLAMGHSWKTGLLDLRLSNACIRAAR